MDDPDQADRDARGDDWADIIDFLTMHPDARWQVARALSEMSTEGYGWNRNARASDAYQLSELLAETVVKAESLTHS